MEGHDQAAAVGNHDSAQSQALGEGEAERYYRDVGRKWSARQAVAIALKRGELVRPANCSACGIGETPPCAHHDSYAEADWLRIEWLCRVCHGRRHRRAKAKKIKVPSQLTPSEMGKRRWQGTTEAERKQHMQEIATHPRPNARKGKPKPPRKAP